MLDRVEFATPRLGMHKVKDLLLLLTIQLRAPEEKAVQMVLWKQELMLQRISQKHVKNAPNRHATGAANATVVRAAKQLVRRRSKALRR